MKSTIVWGVILLATAPVRATVSSYTVTNLGSNGGAVSSAYGINSAGQIAGWSSQAFRTAPYSPINLATDMLGTLGGPWSDGRQVNTAGRVVGYSPNGAGFTHAFRTAPNAAINPATDDLGTLGGDDSYASDINAAGQTTGDARTTGNANYHAFRVDSGAMIDLGTLGGQHSYGMGINASGQVVGYSYQFSGVGGHLRAFRTAANSPIVPANDLGTLGGTDSAANGINDSGQVVGYANLSNTALHAFRTAPNAAINPATDDLGSLGGTSAAWAIDSAGDVVGDSLLADGTTDHAFIYTAGVMRDLNNLIGSASANWTLVAAYDIDDAGHIVGYGYFDADAAGPILPVQRGFLLTVPEPGQLVWVLALATLRRRRANRQA